MIDSVWPRFANLAPSTPGLDVLCEQLNEHRDFFVFPLDHPGPDVTSMISCLAQKYIAGANLDSTVTITLSLDWCKKMSLLQLCTVVIQRLCDENNLNAAYLDKVLLPFLPHLKKWGVANQWDIKPAIQTILVAWVEKVLGPFPASYPSLDSQLAPLSKWVCSCPHCSSARAFLSKSHDHSKSLERIGAPKRRHLETHLSAHAYKLATWETINTSPHGIQVEEYLWSFLV